MAKKRGKSNYVPDRGELVWLTFDPQAGHEQAGRRPALVISPKIYNDKSGLALFCPITSRVKGYPFEIPIDADLSISGVVLSDQIRSLDWRARRAELIARVPIETFRHVLAKVSVLLDDAAY